jgi:REP element-mobilizing transposase RayT
MQKIEPLEYGKYYHIYNCGINGEDLFREAANYEHFLRLYDKYIDPVADTFAWCLIKNHFHLLLRIKDENVASSNLTGFQNLSGLNKPPHQYFSNLFNAYTKAINKRFKRHGSLFERPFKRKHVNSDRYFRKLVVYVHNNPVHHGFCEHPMEWPWSSYLTCISVKTTKLKRNEVIGWFDDVGNFKYMHQQKQKNIEIEKYLEI